MRSYLNKTPAVPSINPAPSIHYLLQWKWRTSLHTCRFMDHHYWPSSTQVSAHLKRINRMLVVRKVFLNIEQTHSLYHNTICLLNFHCVFFCQNISDMMLGPILCLIYLRYLPLHLVINTKYWWFITSLYWNVASCWFLISRYKRIIQSHTLETQMSFG